MFVIARFYETPDQARAAVGSLQEEGFRPSSYAIVTPVTATADEGGSPLVESACISSESIRAGQLLGEHAAFYAENLQEGLSLVVVQPPFGAMKLANGLLNRHDPLPISHEPPIEESTFVPLSDQAAPLSTFLRWETLSKEPAPLSEYWGFPLLSNRLSFLSRWFPSLTKPDFAFFGASNLVRSPSPLSSMFGLPTLSGRSGDSWTSSLGFPLLSGNAAPLSSKLGMPLLSRKRWTY
jgi:hypothetical protein